MQKLLHDPKASSKFLHKYELTCAKWAWDVNFISRNTCSSKVEIISALTNSVNFYKRSQFIYIIQVYSQLMTNHIWLSLMKFAISIKIIAETIFLIWFTYLFMFCFFAELYTKAASRQKISNSIDQLFIVIPCNH